MFFSWRTHCRSNLSLCSRSKVRYRDITGSRYKSWHPRSIVLHVPYMYTSVYIMHSLSAQALNSFLHFMAFGQANSSISRIKLDKNCSGAVYSTSHYVNSNWDWLIKCIWNHQLPNLTFRTPYFFCLVPQILHRLLCVFIIWRGSRKSGIAYRFL